MTAEIPQVVPTEIVAGDSVQWRTPEHSDYTIADSWILTYAFVNANQQFEVTCSDNGDQTHLASMTSAETGLLKSGTYKWQGYVTKGTDRKTLYTGELEVKTNFAVQEDGYDARTFWQITLTNVEAVLQERATMDQSSYTINGRQLSRTPMSDLLELYDKAKYMVAMADREEAINKGLGHKGTIKVRF